MSADDRLKQVASAYDSLSARHHDALFATTSKHMRRYMIRQRIKDGMAPRMLMLSVAIDLAWRVASALTDTMVEGSPGDLIRSALKDLEDQQKAPNGTVIQ